MNTQKHIGANSAVTNPVRMFAVLPQAATNDLINTNQVLTLSVPKTPEVFDYDDDGNLLSDGKFSYTWNAENRLIQVSNFQFQVSYAYDHQGRRVQKQLYELITNNWELITETKFLWNGNHIISEICHDPSEMQTNVSSFVWGNNGQLVSFVTEAQGLEPQAFFYCHDGNKNVTDLVNASGAIVAHYEYDPFGNINVTTGELADENPFRFSNEYFDTETGLVTYKYRPYNPSAGSWINRDPIAEQGGINLYGFICNDGVNKIDLLGHSGAPGSYIPGGGGWGVGQGIPIVPGDPIEKPSFGESLVPIYGSGINASYNFQEGNYGWGIFYSAMAVTDISLVQSLAQSFGKGCWKVGSHSWSATRSWLGEKWSLPKYTEVHHWLIGRGSWLGQKFPQVVNQQWNLVPVYKTSEHSSRVFHMAIHGSQATLSLSVTQKFWYGTPQYAKAALLSASFRSVSTFEKIGDSNELILIDDTGEEQTETYLYEEQYGPLRIIGE